MGIDHDQISADIKRQLKELAERRTIIEGEINTCSARLETAGVGMEGKLIDEEGFPRSDIDIPQVRGDRHKIITLSNDHKELTNQMEELLHKLHAHSRHEGSLGPIARPRAAAGHDEIAEVGGAVAVAVESHSTRPFAVIDIVEPNSPASEAGIRVGDMMIRFGSVTGQTPNFMAAVAKALQEHENRRIETEVLREIGQTVLLVLEPKKWSGRGLLGCHLAPL